MKRILPILAILLAVCALPVVAADSHMVPGEKAVTKTVSGEVVDMGCYLGHAARGANHVSCATKCINQGMPMGLLTSDGTLYLVTMSHENADPYNNLKTMAGKNVAVTGELLTRNGMKAIEASAVKSAGK